VIGEVGGGAEAAGALGTCEDSAVLLLLLMLPLEVEGWQLLLLLEVEGLLEVLLLLLHAPERAVSTLAAVLVARARAFALGLVVMQHREASLLLVSEWRLLLAILLLKVILGLRLFLDLALSV
jgi:hypothetical protein